MWYVLYTIFQYCSFIYVAILLIQVHMYGQMQLYRYATYRSSRQQVYTRAYECTLHVYSFINTFIKAALTFTHEYIPSLTNTITQIKRDLNLQQNVADSILQFFNTQPYIHNQGRHPASTLHTHSHNCGLYSHIICTSTWEGIHIFIINAISISPGQFHKL